MNKIKRESLIGQISVVIGESYVVLSDIDKNSDLYQTLTEFIEVAQKTLQAVATE